MGRGVGVEGRVYRPASVFVESWSPLIGSALEGDRVGVAERRSRMWSPTWDRDSAPVKIPRRAGFTAVQVGSSPPRSDPRTSIRVPLEVEGGSAFPSQPRCSTPIGWLMAPNRVRSQDQLPGWQAGADAAALQPLGTEPSCAGGWDRRQLPVGAPALRPFSAKFRRFRSDGW